MHRLPGPRPAAGKEKGRREEVPAFSSPGQREEELAASPGRRREEEPPAGYSIRPPLS